MDTMKKGVVAVVILFIFAAMAGCTNPPTPPASEMPKLVIDYDINEEGRNETIIFIHGLDETRYSRITLFIDDEEIANKTDTFSVERRTDLREFNLTVNVTHLEERYNYNASFEVVREEDLIYEITYYDEETKEVKYEDLPLVERLNLMEEEE